MNVAFYLASAVALVATLIAITRTHPVHALLYFVVSLLSVAVVFFTLGAPFVAALEVIVYAGAIIVLFIFVVMLLNLGPDASAGERRLLGPRIWVGPVVLASVLGMELVWIVRRGAGVALPLEAVGPKEVSLSLMGPYVLGVEIASMLLLAGLVGAYHLGRRGKETGS
jgi:NADH-quinone oxidoreductase subunit J